VTGASGGAVPGNGGPVSGNGGGPAMRFSVDAWDPAYGTNLELEDFLGESTARVEVNVELPASQWRPVDPDPGRAVPAALLFVDGVRRIEARVWIEEDPPDGGALPEASAALCASYAAGVVCCCGQQAHIVLVETRRGLFTVAPRAESIATWAGEYTACRTKAHPDRPLPVTLSQALQRRLGDIEVQVAVSARASVAGHGVPEGGDLLVIDGPLHGRQHLPRAIGYIKSHRTTYLPPPLNALVGTLRPGQRTPVFLIGTSWDRHTWYLRLPSAAFPAGASPGAGTPGAANSGAANSGAGTPGTSASDTTIWSSPPSRQISRRSAAISASRLASKFAAATRASPVARAWYPISPNGSGKVATSPGVSSLRIFTGRSRSNSAISPPRPMATTTTPPRIAAAASKITRYTPAIVSRPRQYPIPPPPLKPSPEPLSPARNRTRGKDQALTP
jgi:hypothetical protein